MCGGKVSNQSGSTLCDAPLLQKVYKTSNGILVTRKYPWSRGGKGCDLSGSILVPSGKQSDHIKPEHHQTVCQT